jgi:hypothetical protein
MTDVRIHNFAEWNPLTIAVNPIKKLTFENVTDTINIDRLPLNIKIISLGNSPNIRFTGNSTNYKSVFLLYIRQDVGILDWPNDIISRIQPSYVFLMYSGDGIRMSLKSNLVISYPLTHISLANCDLATDSLDNILSFTSLTLFLIENSIVPRLSASIETLDLMHSGTIIFTEQLPIRLKKILITACEIDEAAAAMICNLDFRRRQSNLPDLDIQVQGTRVPALAFCPTNYYRDLNNNMQNVSRVALRKHLPNEMGAHIQSYLGGTRKVKRNNKTGRVKAKARARARARARASKAPRASKARARPRARPRKTRATR